MILNAFMVSSTSTSHVPPENRVQISSKDVQDCLLLIKDLMKKQDNEVPSSSFSSDSAASMLRSIKQRFASVTHVLINEQPLNLLLYDLSISLFPSLMELYLDSIPLSTIRDLFSLRMQLKRLEAVNSGVTCMKSVFLPIDRKHYSHLSPCINTSVILCRKDHDVTLNNEEKTKRHDEKYCWLNLSSLRLVNCGIASLDESCHFFPSLETFDISHNDISAIKHLQDCFSLSVLNASFNRISSLTCPRLDLVLGNISILNLSNNRIQHLNGIEKLYSVVSLDLRCNLIDDFEQGNSIMLYFN